VGKATVPSFSRHYGRPRVEGCRGLLGHFISAQMDRIAEPFQIAVEQVPWTSVINPLWAEPLLRVEVAWDGLEPSVATVTITPHYGFLPSPSAWIPSMPNCKVLGQEPITSTSTPVSDSWSTWEPTIVGASTLMAPPNILGVNSLRARRNFVAESFPQPTVALEWPTACRSDSLPKEPLQNVYACPLPRTSRWRTCPLAHRRRRRRRTCSLAP